MAQGKKSSDESDKTTELLKDILIAQLGTAGVPQLEIRDIVGVRLKRVNRIVRHMTTRKPRTGSNSKSKKK